MKALAASSIGQYQQSVSALADYSRTLELGLSQCLPQSFTQWMTGATAQQGAAVPLRAIVFGSDQGLVGRFNEVIVEQAIAELAGHRRKSEVWAVGERVHARLADAGLAPQRLFEVPGSVDGVAPLVAQILVGIESTCGNLATSELYLFYNQLSSEASYRPVSLRLLPLDHEWMSGLRRMPWPTPLPPEVFGERAETLRSLLGEYIFIAIFRACAESLASENSSRLAAMQRADSNIDDLLVGLHVDFHRLRQSGIDEELFDVVAGFEALSGSPPG